MKRIHPIYLSILSGLLLFAAWPILPFTALIFVGIIPMLQMETQIKKRSHFFWLLYLALLIWNFCTTWWVINSTVLGGVLAIVLNPLLMSIPWMGFYNMKKRFGPGIGYFSLIVFWLSFEYIHLTWELSWPWLTLGNVFATHPEWVQWYQYTGTSGGSLWILLINIFIFRWLTHPAEISRSGKPPGRALRYLFRAIYCLLIPFFISFLVTRFQQSGSQTTTGGSRVPNIVLVQPNIDPWDEKFVAGKEEAELRKLIRLSESQIDSNTSLVVWPETAVPVSIPEDSLRSYYFMQPVWDFLKAHPALNLLTGVEGFRFYDAAHKTAEALRLPNTDKFYEEYNSAVLMDSTSYQVYHKSKLVPGAETLPFFLKFMGPLFEQFGGTAGGYVKQDDRRVMKTFNAGYAIAPAVCYESIYGEFMSTYIRGGANLIVIITNDGWWRNTSGYKQHESYARLRAIETRRWVARSANTGITCFIDPQGQVINPQPYNTVASIKLSIPLSSPETTFYVEHGDIISKGAMTCAILLVIWDLIAIIKSKSKRG